MLALASQGSDGIWIKTSFSYCFIISMFQAEKNVSSETYSLHLPRDFSPLILSSIIPILLY